MSKLKAFSHNATLTAAVTPAASTAALTLPPAGESLLVYNPTNGIVFVRVDGQAATANDFPVPAGLSRLLDIGSIIQTVTLFQASGATAGNVYLSRGDGNTY